MLDHAPHRIRPHSLEVLLRHAAELLAAQILPAPFPSFFLLGEHLVIMYDLPGFCHRCRSVVAGCKMNIIQLPVTGEKERPGPKEKNISFSGGDRNAFTGSDYVY